MIWWHFIPKKDCKRMESLSLVSDTSSRSPILHATRLPTVGYTTRDVIYRWNPSRQVAIAEDMKLSQFDLVDCPAGNTTDRVVHQHSEHPLQQRQQPQKRQRQPKKSFIGEWRSEERLSFRGKFADKMKRLLLRLRLILFCLFHSRVRVFHAGREFPPATSHG